jgi:hypothetical protein
LAIRNRFRDCRVDGPVKFRAIDQNEYGSSKNPSADSPGVIGQIDRRTGGPNHEIYPETHSEISGAPTEDSGCDRGLELDSPRFPASPRTPTGRRKKSSGATSNNVTPIHPIRLLRRYPNRLAHPLTACRSNETKRCGIKSSPMSDTKAARFTLELITDCMNELARELGTMVN